MFKDLPLNNCLERLGFVRLQGFQASTLSELWELYQNTYIQTHKYRDLMVTHNINHQTSPFQIHKKISSIVSNDLNKLLSGYKIFASHFAVKKAHSQNAFQLHQDWSITDETQFPNFQIWIPLSTAYPENGGMCFLPQSHLFYSNLRSGSHSIPRVEIEEKLYPYLSFCRLLKGEAVAFYTKTFHGSFLNSTPEDRVGVILNLLPMEAPTYYYHREKTGETSVHTFTTQTLFEHLQELEKGLLPFSNPIETLSTPDYQNDAINAIDLLEKVNQFALSENRRPGYEHKETHILRNADLEKEINHWGFETIDFLGPDEITSLQEVFKTFFPDRSVYQGSYSSMSVLDSPTRKKAHEAIQAIIKPKLDLLFKNYFCPVSLLYSRRPDGYHKLEWHSDPAFHFNEHLVPIYGIWCPLHEVTPETGGLKLMPGGHRLVPKLNLTFLNWKWPLDDYRTLLDTYGKGFHLKPGQALIYDTRMIHSSEPNNGNFERDNIVMRICPQGSEFFKFVKQTDQIGQIFQVDQSHFFTENAKLHHLPPHEKAENQMYIFDYELTETKIRNYFKALYDQ